MLNVVQHGYPEDCHRRRLQQLGLHAEALGRIGQRMVEATITAPPFGAQNARGFLRYNAALSGLGEEFQPRGWVRQAVNGLELLLHPDRKLAIVVQSVSQLLSGDSKEVVAKFWRGPAVRRRIEANQLELWGPAEGDAPEPLSDLAGFTMWMLAHKYEQQRLTLDLVLPASVGDDHRTILYVEDIHVGTFGPAPIDDIDPLPGSAVVIPGPGPVAGPTIRIEPIE